VGEAVATSDADSFIQMKYVQQLRRLIYLDPGIRDSLQALQQSHDPDVCQAAVETLLPGYKFEMSSIYLDDFISLNQ
jgi:hypothetical protein